MCSSYRRIQFDPTEKFPAGFGMAQIAGPAKT